MDIDFFEILELESMHLTRHIAKEELLELHYLDEEDNGDYESEEKQ
jgi:hypothetical protein